jgi:hypothetical protein
LLTFVGDRASALLENQQSEGGGSTINGKHYDLKVRNKTVCPVAFARLMGISKTTLLTLNRNAVETPLTPVSVPFIKLPNLNQETETIKGGHKKRARCDFSWVHDRKLHRVNGGLS